jgi:hypothetical protein
MLCKYAGQGEGWPQVITNGYVFNQEPSNLVPGGVQYKRSKIYFDCKLGEWGGGGGGYIIDS